MYGNVLVPRVGPSLLPRDGGPLYATSSMTRWFGPLPAQAVVGSSQSLAAGRSSPSLGAGGSCKGPPCSVSGQTLAAGGSVQALNASGLGQALGAVGSNQALVVGWGQTNPGGLVHWCAHPKDGSTPNRTASSSSTGSARIGSGAATLFSIRARGVRSSRSSQIANSMSAMSASTDCEDRSTSS